MNLRPPALSSNWNIKGSWWRGPKFYSQFSYFLWWIFSLSLLLANGMSLGFLCCSPPTRLLMVLFLVVREIIHHSSVQKWEGFTRKPYRVANTSSLDTHEVPTYYPHWAKKDLLFSNGFTWQKLDWWKVARNSFFIILFQCLLMWHILLPRLCTYFAMFYLARLKLNDLFFPIFKNKPATLWQTLWAPHRKERTCFINGAKLRQGWNRGDLLSILDEKKPVEWDDIFIWEDQGKKGPTKIIKYNSITKQLKDLTRKVLIEILLSKIIKI